MTLDPALNFKFKGNEFHIRSNLFISIETSPNPVDFGTIEIGAIKDRSIRLKNLSNVELIITRFEFSHEGYSSHPDVTFPIILRPRQIRVISIRYTAIEIGYNTGALTMYSKDLAHEPIMLYAMTQAESIRLSPPNLDFSKLRVGNSMSYPIRIWNSTKQRLIITKATVSNLPFSINAVLPIVIEAGSCGRFEVIFNAIEGKNKQAILELEIEGVTKAFERIPLAGSASNEFPFTYNDFMQASNAKLLANEVVGQLVAQTNELKEDGSLILALKLFKLLDTSNLLDGVSLNAPDFGIILGEKFQSLVFSLTPILEENKLYKELSLTPFDFLNFRGNYYWETESERFNYTANDNGLNVFFPSEENNENDMLMRLSEYEEISFKESAAPQREFYQPSRVLMSMKKGEKEIALVDVSYEYHANGTAKKASGEIKLAMLSVSFSFDNIKSKEFSLNMMLHNQKKAITTVAINGLFSQNTKVLSNLQLVSGSATIYDLEINGQYDHRIYLENDNDTEKYLRLNVTDPPDKNVGIFNVENEWSEDNDRMEEVYYLKYVDSSKDKLESLLKPWIDCISGLFTEES
ncbi:MAG: hypothetical protein RIE58_01305 [Vicingaceae bacterium]